MRATFLKILGCSFWLHLLFTVPCTAEVITRITISGNQHVSNEKILRVLQLEEGDTFNEEGLRAAIKRLFATKEFSDLKLYKIVEDEGITLELEVAEYARVDEVRFENVKHIDEEEIQKAVSMARGSFLRPSVVSGDRDAITELYKEKGYFRAAVHDSLQWENKKQVLVYTMEPGNKVSIKHIDFFGNTALESNDLRDVMESKEDRWWRGGDFKPNVLEEDKQRVMGLYREHGYLDVEIKDTEMVFSEDGKDLDIFFSLDEGTQYRVGRLKWTGNELIADDEIVPFITLSEGNVFNESEFSNIQIAISSLYWDRGYIYNSVTPVKNRKGEVIDVDLEITEGTPAHINEVNITGNSKTAEKVIRRELVVFPGDVFSRPKLIRSLREVFNLGFFAGPPEVNTPPANSEGDININLSVQEKQTGQFRLGAGFSALNSISGFFGVSENNFLGKGQRIGVDWEFSKYRQNIDLRFTEPWVMGTPTELSINLYNMVQNQVQQQFYDDRRRGFSVRVGRPFPWYDYTTVYWRYRYEAVELTNFASGYNGPLAQIDWPQRTSSTAVTIARNSTDSPFHPSVGTAATVTAEWNGGTLLGGDAKFQQYEASFSWYTRLFWKFVLEMNIQAGVKDGYNRPQQVPDYELYRLGGNRRYGLRGYDFYEIIPEGNPQYIGGRYMQILSYEVSYEIAPTVYGLLFLDSGNAWNSFREADIFDLKKGLGLGVRIELPALGTVGLDYGYGFDKPGGGGWEPHISLGGMF